MKKNRFRTSITAASFILLAILVVFSCQKENEISIDEGFDTQIRKAANGQFERQIVLNDLQSQTQIQLIIKAENPDILAQVSPSEFQVTPLFAKEEEFTELAASAPTIATPQVTNTVDIEVVESSLPPNALGYKLVVSPSVSSEGEKVMHDLWVYTIRVGNRRQAVITRNSGPSLSVVSDYSTCSNIGGYVESSGWKNVSGATFFGTTPSAVGFFRVQIAYIKNGNTFSADFYYQGSCGRTEGTCSTSDQACNHSHLTNDLPPTTMRQMSQFVSTEMDNTVKEMLGVYLANRQVFNQTFENNPDVQEAVNEFIKKNNTLLVNGFANDNTQLQARHIEPALQVLDLLNTKIQDPEINGYLQKVRQNVVSMQGKEVKSALKELDRAQFTK